MEGSSERVLTPKARRTRERILEAALGLFADRGYEPTTMRAVAREAGAAMLARLDQVSPHRGPLAALLARALDPNSRLSALGGGTAAVREKMGDVFLEVVRGASDAPGEKQAVQLGNVLYALHLAILLYWFHDRTPEARATRELVGSARETLRYLRPVLRLPPMSRVLSRLAGALGDIGMNVTAPTAEQSGGAR
jgi:hypothetical protein